MCHVANACLPRNPETPLFCPEKSDKCFNLFADLSKTLFKNFGTPEENESFRQVVNFEKCFVCFDHNNIIWLSKSMNFFFLFLYQKYKFEFALNTPPPTPLEIAEIFVGLVHDDECSTVMSNEETQASLDTLITHV